ncbi:MAG: hypothetical protein V2A66_08770 [Pseudomonadota bacterium]
MSWDYIKAAVFCLGGFNPLCWAGCGNDIQLPPPAATDGGKIPPVFRNPARFGDSAALRDMSSYVQAGDMTEPIVCTGVDTVEVVSYGGGGKTSGNVKDIDVRDNHLTILSDLNLMLRAKLDPANPGKQLAPTWSKPLGTQINVEKNATISPVQVVDFLDGTYMVPFTVSGSQTFSSGADLVSVDPKATLPNLDAVKGSTLNPVTLLTPAVSIKPEVLSGLIYSKRAIVASSNCTDKPVAKGCLLSYGIVNGSFETSNNVQLAAWLTGKNALAVEMLDGTMAAALSNDVDKNGVGTMAYIDIVDLSLPFTSATSPKPISLGIGDAVSFGELAVTDDKSHAAVVSKTGEIRYVDLAAQTVASSFDLSKVPPFAGKPKDLAIDGTTVYVDTDQYIFVVDFSDAANPKVSKVMYPGAQNLGAMAIYNSTYLYVVSSSDCGQYRDSPGDHVLGINLLNAPTWSAPPVPDMTVVPDMSVPPDLRVPPDLMVSRDMPE